MNKNPIKEEPSEALSSEKSAVIILEQAQEIKKLQTQLNWLTEQLKLLKHGRYAKSSETQSSLQRELFDENDLEIQTAASETPEKESITYERRKPQRKPRYLDTSRLPREQRILDLSAEEKICACGHCLEKMGEESKEELVFQPAVLKVIEHIRIKYTCRHCNLIKTPPVVELPLSKSKVGAALLAEIILNKYHYHLPFYRQCKVFARHPIALSDSTIAGWAMQAAERLAPLYDAGWKQLSLVGALQADETPVKVLHPEKKGYMWLYHCYLPGKRFIIFDFNLSRSAAVVDARLKDFKGLLQTDGYSGYNTQRKRGDVVTLGCWDHARRKFSDVVKASGNNKSGKAGGMLERIAKLYLLERGCKGLPYEERKALRQKKAKPLLEAIRSFLYKINAPPKSLLGMAVTYCKNQWGELIRYVDYGEAEFSNIWVENQVRPFAVGRRNWLFVGNAESASKAALLYGLIQSCELNNIDPRNYLEYVLGQVHRMRRGEVDPLTLLPNTIDPDLIKK